MVGRPVLLSGSESLWRSYVRSKAARGRILNNRRVVGDRAPARPFEVVILAVLERPEKAGQAETAERQCQRHQKYQDFHQQSSLAPRWARNAFRITSSDEPDIAAAAISGVAKPAMASGTAKRL